MRDGRILASPSRAAAVLRPASRPRRAEPSRTSPRSRPQRTHGLGTFGTLVGDPLGRRSVRRPREVNPPRETGPSVDPSPSTRTKAAPSRRSGAFRRPLNSSVRNRTPDHVGHRSSRYCAVVLCRSGGTPLAACRVVWCRVRGPEESVGFSAGWRWRRRGRAAVGRVGRRGGRRTRRWADGVRRLEPCRTRRRLGGPIRVRRWWA